MPSMRTLSTGYQRPHPRIITRSSPFLLLMTTTGPQGQLTFPRFGGSSAFVVLSNKEKVARADSLRQPLPTQCLRDDFLLKILPNTVLHWILGGSIQWLSMGNAEEPNYCTVSMRGLFCYCTQLKLLICSSLLIYLQQHFTALPFLSAL